MKYKTKSIIVGRKKKGRDDKHRQCFISMFDVNEPHKSSNAPKKVLDFDNIHQIIIKRLDINYLLPGNDLVIDNLEYFNVDIDGCYIKISGKQSK